MAAKDDIKARPEHFDEWSASGSDDDENQHLCAPQGNGVSDSSAADEAATPLLECEESRQQHASTPFIRLVDTSSAAAPWFQGHRPLLLLLALVCGVTIMTNCTEGMRAHMLEHRWPAHVATIGYVPRKCSARIHAHGLCHAVRVPPVLAIAGGGTLLLKESHEIFIFRSCQTVLPSKKCHPPPCHRMCHTKLVVRFPECGHRLYSVLCISQPQ
eukprot:TRINITY_DN3906_c0_g1_i1.p1 TRINITY_DN3906_c0_g1~~TRINITY_DN3906_c0_g1_i1.p1  ORF type:complete len:238 (+),score=27.28 TRINITY_DN3906_c0_g1_i1:73-714(+)